MATPQQLHQRWLKEMQAILGEEKLRSIDLFRRYDKNNDGCISRAEFTEALEACEVSLTPAEIRTLVDFMDTDGQKGIDYFEFTNKLRYKHIQSHQNVIHHNQNHKKVTTTTTKTTTTSTRSGGASKSLKLTPKKHVTVEATDDESDWSAWEDDREDSQSAHSTKPKPSSAKFGQAKQTRSLPSTKQPPSESKSKDVVLDVSRPAYEQGTNSRSFHAPLMSEKAASAPGGILGCGPTEVILFVLGMMWLYWLISLPTGARLDLEE